MILYCLMLLILCQIDVPDIAWWLWGTGFALKLLELLLSIIGAFLNK